jgi:hypothetical protein
MLPVPQLHNPEARRVVEMKSEAVLVIKPTRCSISQIYFWNRTLNSVPKIKKIEK